MDTNKKTSATLKSTIMKSSKKLFILSAVISGSLFATTAYSQVYVNAHIGFGLPVRRVYYTPPPPPPPVVYQEQYPVAPAPVCQDGSAYDQDGYGQGSTTVVYENEFPGYAYYSYPSWNGHYRDRYYYAHYRPYFERDNRAYFNGGRFQRDRYVREHYNQGGRRYANRGYNDRGNNDRERDHRRNW